VTVGDEAKILAMAPPQEIGVRCGARFTTYPELFEHAGHAAQGLSELGIGAGDRVAVLLRNSIEFLEASIATVPLGAGAVPLNWHCSGEELAYMLADSGARVLIAHDNLWSTVSESVPDGVTLVIVPSDDADMDIRPPAGALLWRDWLASGRSWGATLENAPLSIIYTSGTTGQPKGVVRTVPDDAKREAVRAKLASVFGIGTGERTLIPAPLYHSAPNGYAHAAAIREMDMTLMKRFDPEDFLALVAERRVTVVQMVPTMFVRLLALPDEVRSRYDLSSLRWVVHGAAPCPPNIKLAMIRWLGPIVTEYYGSTETGPITFCTSQEWLAHPGTVGRPLEGAVVKVLDAEGGELGPGESGEIYMWLDVWPDFTYAGDAAKRRAVEREGLVSCGDIGYLDEDGFLYLNDRRSDIVISGGVNIYSIEIEDCLLSLAAVRDCAVFGVPDDEYGEALAVHLELEDGATLTAEAVREHVRSHLAAYKAPRVVEFSDSLPREDSGKIFKRRLREPYWAGRDRPI